MPGASAQAAEARAKVTRPIRYVRLRPIRSPSSALGIIKAAKLRLKALTVHSRLAIDASRPRAMVCSAVATTS